MTEYIRCYNCGKKFIGEFGDDYLCGDCASKEENEGGL